MPHQSNTHKKILKTLYFGATYGELGKLTNTTPQNIYKYTKKLTKEEVAKVKNKRLAKIKEIMEE